MNSHTVPDLQTGIASQPSGETVLRLENVSVRYRAPQDRVNTLKEYAIRRLQQRIQYNDFNALDEVTFEVNRGEIFGIIGRNGAGKSTLLKVISRVIIPTQGRVWIKGRISPMLELGAGFHPELTGRENVFLNGTLLGHARREIEACMDSILEFADLGGFIEAPLRTFSSGMVARLGFAVATAWQPEILILDEVLAVGDETFRRKCLSRMESFRSSGTTTLMVTHDLKSVLALCTHTALLDHGKILAQGPTNDVVQYYVDRETR